MPFETAPLGAVVGWAALVETDVAGLTRADLLGLLSMWAEVDEVPAVVLEQVVSTLAREELTTAEVDFYDPLVDKLRELLAPDEPATTRTPVGPARCVELVRGITSPMAGRRVTWAGVAVEWVQAGELAAHEAGPIAAVLGWTALVETTKTFPNRQRLLRALSVVAQAGLAPTAVLEQVTTQLPRAELNADETGLLDTLVGQLDRRRGPGPPPRVAGCVELLRGITGQYRDERFAWAGVAGQRHEAGKLDAADAAPIAGVLGWCAAIETDVAGGTRARMLDSLAALARSNLVPVAALEQVTSALSRDQLDATEAAACDMLANKVNERSASSEPAAPGRTPLGPVQCVRLVRGLVTESPHWAGATAMWLDAGELDAHEATTIATVLAWAALLDPSDTFPTRQRVLHSLTRLAELDLAPTAALDKVTAHLTRQDLGTAEAQLYDELVEQIWQVRGR